MNKEQMRKRVELLAKELGYELTEWQLHLMTAAILDSLTIRKNNLKKSVVDKKVQE